MRSLFVTIGLLGWLSATGQQVGIGTLTPHPSALVEMKSSSSGLLIPRLTTAQRNAINNPAHSLLIFNVDNFCLEAYDSFNQKWLLVSCPSVCNPCDTCPLPIIDSITGPVSVCPGDTAAYQLWGTGGGVFWNMPSDWIMLSQGSQAVFIPGTNGTVYGYLCNECGCVMDSITTILGAQPSSVTVNPTTASICVGDTLILVAISTGATFYQWAIPVGWTVIGPSNQDTLRAVITTPGTYTFSVKGCNGCGCTNPVTISVTVNLGALNPPVSITGPNIACLPDTIVWKAPHASGASWTWSYPSSWTLIAQGGDSIVISPDTADGDLIVTVCDANCNCTYDTLSIITDSCNSFCTAIGGIGNDMAYYLTESPDGGLVAVGRTSSFGVGSWDVYAVKVDQLGNLVWTRTVGSGNIDYGSKIITTYDGGFAIGGMSFLGDEYLYVIKLDASGNHIWSRHAGTGTEEVGYCIAETSDSGLIAAGYKRLGTAGGNDIYIVKYDSAGNLQWLRTVGGFSHERAYGITTGPNNSAVLTGYTWSAGQGATDVIIVKLDGSGNVVWSKTVGGSGGDVANDITMTSDSGYVIVGYTTSFGAGGNDVYVVKIDSSGNLQWTKVIGGSGDDVGYSIRQTRDGGYIIGGYTNSFGAGNYDMYAIKLDNQGNLQWTRTIGGNGDDRAYGVVELSRGGYGLAGYTSSFGSGGVDMYLVTLNSSGQLRICPGGCQTGSGGTTTTGGVMGNGPISTSSPGGSGISGFPSSGGTLVNLCP